MADSGQVIYGALNHGGIVFIPEPVAADLAATHEALGSAGRWEELTARLPSARMEQIRERLEDATEPAPGTPFDASEIAGYDDGDWPEWPAQAQLEWMPDDAQAHGEVMASVINGDFLEFSDGGAARAVVALEASGYTVRRDDALVQAASGE